MTLLRRSVLCATCALVVVASPSVVVRAQAAPAAQAAPKTIPAKLTDQEFWKFTVDMSEPGGYFRSENILSNETGYQQVITKLLAGPRQDRVYLGVAPEQNFTYIAALKPKIAIIFDIRRGNLLEHLLYKALFELSADRAEFVSRLFTKPRPKGLDSATSADSLMNAYWYAETADTVAYRKNREAITDLLTKKHAFPLSSDDLNDLFWIYDFFYFVGPSITYTTSSSGPNSGRGGGGRRMPTYKDIITATDEMGRNRGFLGSESNFRYIKDLEAKNLIVPVVGNFAGDKAIRSVATWLKDRNALVGAFYTSNVEQYLWQDRIAYAYYDNVAQLPIDSLSVFIRSGNIGGFGGFGGGGGMREPNHMCRIQDLLGANKAGRITIYSDIFNYCQ